MRRYGDTVVVICILEIQAIVNGANWGGKMLINDVWVNQHDQWRVVTRHSSPVGGMKDEG
jgi:hypothetical protein